MTTKTLVDTRDLTQEQVDRHFERWARLSWRRRVREAQLEDAIARLKSAHAEADAQDAAQIEQMEGQIGPYILGHQEQFASPRTRKTPFGEYGLRTVSGVEVADKEALAQWAFDRGYTDLVKVEYKPQLKAVEKRVRAGEELPGATLTSGVRVHLKLAESLPEQA